MRNRSRTQAQFDAYQEMADYLNKALFDGKLPQVILNFSRKSRAYGFFAPERWSKGGETAHEISLNPEHLAVRPARDVAGTLAHELAHLWQQEFGNPSRNGYHNREWADKMEEIGLYPSTTGAPGGKRTGQKCSHFVVEGGPFDKAWGVMPDDYLLPWACSEEVKAAKKPSGRFKYECGGCGAKAWGKEGLSLKCVECDEELGSEPVGEAPAPKVPLKIAADKKGK